MFLVAILINVFAFLLNAIIVYVKDELVFDKKLNTYMAQFNFLLALVLFIRWGIVNGYQ